MSRRQFTGLAAEDIALRHYLAQGARLAARRWRCPEGEIDLILRFPGLVVFVEVKARRRGDDAAAAVSPRQWQRIGAAASRWLARETDGTLPCRFDLVAIDGSGACACVENVMPMDDMESW